MELLEKSLSQHVKKTIAKEKSKHGVLKVLQVCGDIEYGIDAEGERAAAVPASLMKPYANEMYNDDYTDEFLNERNAIETALWRTLNKQQQLYYKNKRLPLRARKTKRKNGNAMASKEIAFENLNDLSSYKTKSAIWPKLYSKQRQQHHDETKLNGDNDGKQLRHSLQQFVVVHSLPGDDAGADKQSTPLANIRYKHKGILQIPIVMEKHFKTKTSKGFPNEADAGNSNNMNERMASVDGNDGVQENLFPLKYDNSLNVNDVADDEDGNADSDSYEKEIVAVVDIDEEPTTGDGNGNGNESFNYTNNKESNTDYIMPRSNNNYYERALHRKQQYKPHDKRAKAAIGHTSFLPAVSGGAMTNLGKFFRDLSKNVHDSEKYQWDAEQQKLLEGDPKFGNMHHHLTKPNAATDEQTAEWIKAIRFYRPSQKIRSLVEMNPHGQWAHSSQFIDPNYMWVGLGK